MKHIIPVVAIFITSAPSSVSSEMILYDVDFGTPPHTVGAPPTIGFGPTPRSTPSTRRSGVIDASFGALADQPLAFLPDAFSSAGVAFWLGSGANPRTGDPGLGTTFSAYEVEMDVLIQAIIDSPFSGEDADFKIEVDAPFAHQLRFTHDGGVRAITFGDDGISETRIGSFVRGIPFHLRLGADLGSDSWSIDLDGQRAFAGSFPNEGSVWDVQVVLNRGSLVAAVGIDNVRITGLPEPSVGVMVLAGLSMLCARTRPRHHLNGSAGSRRSMQHRLSPFFPKSPI